MRRLTALAGPSGAGKTALVLDSLIPAARALLSGSALPGHVRRLELGGIRQVVQIDASPIGQNARSTPATYCGAFDQIRRVFAESAYARRRRWKPGHFSFNTREGQCPTCRGLGHIDLDVQYLPDITVELPDLPRRPLQRRHPGRPGRRPDHGRRARPERGRRPGAVR